MIKYSARLSLFGLAACCATALAGTAASLFFWSLTFSILAVGMTATLMMVQFIRVQLKKRHK